MANNYESHELKGADVTDIRIRYCFENDLRPLAESAQDFGAYVSFFIYYSGSQFNY
jgi:hypothetical protein